MKAADYALAVRETHPGVPWVQAGRLALLSASPQEKALLAERAVSEAVRDLKRATTHAIIKKASTYGHMPRLPITDEEVQARVPARLAQLRNIVLGWGIEVDRTPELLVEEFDLNGRTIVIGEATPEEFQAKGDELLVMSLGNAEVAARYYGMAQW